MSLHFFPTPRGGINSAQIFYIRRLPVGWRLIRPGTTNNSRRMDHITDEEVGRWSKDMPDGWLEIVDLEKQHIFLNLNMVGWYSSQSEPDDRWRHSFSAILLNGSWTVLSPEFSVVLGQKSLTEAIASSQRPTGERIRLGFSDGLPALPSETAISEEVDHATAQVGSLRRIFGKKS